MLRYSWAPFVGLVVTSLMQNEHLLLLWMYPGMFTYLVGWTSFTSDCSDGWPSLHEMIDISSCCNIAVDAHEIEKIGNVDPGNCTRRAVSRIPLVNPQLAVQKNVIVRWTDLDWIRQGIHWLLTVIYLFSAQLGLCLLSKFHVVWKVIQEQYQRYFNWCKSDILCIGRCPRRSVKLSRNTNAKTSLTFIIYPKTKWVWCAYYEIERFIPRAPFNGLKKTECFLWTGYWWK